MDTTNYCEQCEHHTRRIRELEHEVAHLREKPGILDTTRKLAESDAARLRQELEVANKYAEQQDQCIAELKAQLADTRSMYCELSKRFDQAVAERVPDGLLEDYTAPLSEFGYHAKAKQILNLRRANAEERRNRC